MDNYTAHKLAKIQRIHQYILVIFSRLNYRIEPSPDVDNNEGEYLFKLLDNTTGQKIGSVSIVTRNSEVVITRGTPLTRNARLPLIMVQQHMEIIQLQMEHLILSFLGLKLDNTS
jgi:hypothetical protein